MITRAAAALLLCALLSAGEALVCRGFDAVSALAAVSSTGGRLVRLGDELADLRQRRLWFVLPDAGGDAAAQALAHALGCWWSSGQGPALGLAARLPAGPATVRSYPAPPLPLADAEGLVRGLIDPWLAGDGGVARDATTLTWTATTSPAGHARLEALLGALTDPLPRAPHLLPASAPNPSLARPPQGTDLAAWALDLARLAGIALALGPELNPLGPPPPGDATDLAGARAALGRLGIATAFRHGCLCLGLAEPDDRRHPAERAVIALLPVRQLCPDEAAVTALAERLTREVSPAAWRQPGWSLVGLPWRRDLLVLGDPPAIHAVMQALERIERQPQP